MRQVEARADQRDGGGEARQNPFEMPDQLGRGSLQNKGWNVLCDLAAEDVGAALADAPEQAQGKHHRIQAVGSDERGQHTQSECERDWTDRGRLLARKGPVANPARRKPGSGEVHRHQQRTERCQPLTVAPNDLSERQDDPRPSRTRRLSA